MEGKSRFMIVNDPVLDLDEAIMRLKDLKKRILVTGLFQPTSVELDVLVEIMEIIDSMEVPIRMSQQGEA